jgi:crotonobetainyl-CoA:carnitine CoA-transferase CaiB-like acyl-CoA transferase
MDAIPRVGEHNAAILRELGFDEPFIERLANPAATAATRAQP